MSQQMSYSADRGKLICIRIEEMMKRICATLRS
jgi:hypothetical protein